jgi:hypothetical protein
MLKYAKLIRLLIAVTTAALSFQVAHAQNGEAANGSGRDVAGTIKAAADALGMVRTGGPGGALLPEIDVVNRMEFLGNGTVAPGNSTDAAGTAAKADYHVALGYNPPAMRVEITRTNAQGHTIQTVRDNYAWNESEIGAGLEPGRGTATPALGDAKNRLLSLWILPYGVIKAAFAAGDKTQVSVENGSTVLSFPLSGELAGVNVKATLDSKNFVTKVETQSENPALTREAEYSDYADHGDIPTDIKSPGHIMVKQGGNTLVDVQIKTWDANNPYLVFPVPQSVKNAAAQETSKVAEKQ